MHVLLDESLLWLIQEIHTSVLHQMVVCMLPGYVHRTRFRE